MKLYTIFFNNDDDPIPLTPVFHYVGNVWCVSHPKFEPETDTKNLFDYLRTGIIDTLYCFNYHHLSANNRPEDFYGNGKAKKRAIVKRFVETLPKPPDFMIDQTTLVPSLKDWEKMKKEKGVLDNND